MKFIAAPWDDRRPTPFPQLFSNSEAELAEFAKNCDRPGRVVCQCVSELQDDAKVRSLQTVKWLTFIHADIDVRALAEDRATVLSRLDELPIPFRKHDSGRGVHIFLDLKEPVTTGTPEYDRVCNLRTALTKLVCGDPASDQSVALLRVVGTHNYKCDPPVVCHIIDPGQPVDITDIEALIEMYQTPLFHPNTDGRQSKKSSSPNGNGYPENDKVDIDGALESMRFEGGDRGIHKTELSVTASMLRAGMCVEEVLAAVKRAVANDVKCAGWDWAAEEETIREMCFTFIEKNQELCILLPEPHISKWREAPAQGKWARFIYTSNAGWHIRAYPLSGKDENGNGHNSSTATNPGAQNGTKKKDFVIRPFAAFDVAALPQREWLLARHYQRRTVSVTAAPGGTGKTTNDMVEGAAMATGRALLGEQPLARLRVWIHNGEDNLTELHRRIAAICQHYEIDMKELEGWLFLTSGNEFPLKVASGFSDLKIDDLLVTQIGGQIATNEIDVCIFDPLITLHQVSEGDNMRMDAVVRIFAAIADAQDCAIELSHHMRKMPSGVDADYTASDIRGATAIFDAVRSARVINRMSERECTALGFQEHERAKYLRVDKAKGNYSPAAMATWRKFENVDLPNGDDVGVIVPWTYPGQNMTAQEIADLERTAERVFLLILRKLDSQGRSVNEKKHANYAPKVFCREREAKEVKLTVDMLEAAMGRLLEKGLIRVEGTGNGHHVTTKLVIVPPIVGTE
jgi:RecA-family ATPase